MTGGGLAPTLHPAASVGPTARGEWVWERGVHKLCMEVKLLIANDFKNILTNK